MIVDAHAHFALPPEASMAEVPAAAGATDAKAARSWRFHKNYTDAELLAIMDQAGVDKLLQVTPSVMRYDNSYSVAGAQRHSDRIRVFAHMDPREADAGATLRRLVSLPYVVGIRVMVLGAEAPLVESDRLDGFWAAAEEARSNIAIYSPHNAAALGRVAQRHPALRLLIDHCTADVFPETSAPDRFAGWEDLLALAPIENVFVKMCGLPDGTREPYPFPKAQDRLRQLFDVFGPDRLLWGSNFPPVAIVATYAQSIDYIRQGCAFLSAADKAKILGETAARLCWPEG